MKMSYDVHSKHPLRQSNDSSFHVRTIWLLKCVILAPSRLQTHTFTGFFLHHQWITVGWGSLLTWAWTLCRTPTHRPLCLLTANVFVLLQQSLCSSREIVLQSPFYLNCKSCSWLYQKMPVTISVCLAVELCSLVFKSLVGAGGSRWKTNISQYMLGVRY